MAVYLWAVIHDRPVRWACAPENWDLGLWKQALPSQSTMSRRLRTTEVQRLLNKVEAVFGCLNPSGWVFEIDGKPLTIGSYSRDRDATWGRACRTFAKGFKLHAFYGAGPMPLEWEITGLNVGEPEVAARLLARRKGGGYVLADKAFDSNPLHDIAAAGGFQLVAERKRPNAGLGHRRHSPHRLRCIELLKGDFGRDLYVRRKDVERQFGGLTNHAGGLAPLPNWVRRSHRVRLWVQAKLIIHAAYVHWRGQPPPLPDA